MADFPEIARFVGTCLEIIALVVATIGATFFAMAKWGFVLQKTCDERRDECHTNCAKMQAASKEGLSYKLDSICNKLERLNEWMDKDHDRYIQLREFVGKVEEFMTSHK